MATQKIQQNRYHLYDVYYHTLSVVDTVSKVLGYPLVLSALFHDVGKPKTQKEKEGRRGEYQFLPTRTRWRADNSHCSKAIAISQKGCR